MYGRRILFKNTRKNSIAKLIFKNWIWLETKIDPNLLSNQGNKTNTLKDGILLYGKYSSSYPNIIISFEAYDVQTWEEKTRRSYRCDMDDTECIKEAFLVCMDENIMPLFCEEYDCMSICGGNALLDCNGECNGSSVLDCNNICVDGFLLDNMPPSLVRKAVSIIRESRHGEKKFIEASGGITDKNMSLYLDTGINAISVGAITHSSPSKDIRLEFL